MTPVDIPLLLKAVVVACSAQFGGCLTLTDDPVVLYHTEETCIARTHEIAELLQPRLEERGFEGTLQLRGYCLDAIEETV